MFRKVTNVKKFLKHFNGILKKLHIIDKYFHLWFNLKWFYTGFISYSFKK